MKKFLVIFSLCFLILTPAFPWSGDVSTYQTLSGGIETVDAAGTAQVLASSTKCKRVSIKAELDNTGNIFVGGSDVDKTTKNGIILDAGEAWIFYVDNLADIWIDASVTGDGVHYTYEI